MAHRRAIALTLLIGGCGAASARPAEDVPALLRTQTQAMLDAVAAGDAAVWDRYLDARAIYVSETGERETKASLLAQLQPLPPGVAGSVGRTIVRHSFAPLRFARFSRSVAIARFDVEVHGDAAVVVHVDRESETFHGQALAAEYVTTSVWRRGAAGWRLIATQVHASLADPPAVSLPPDQLDEYAGSYRLGDDLVYTIRRDGDHLVGQRAGGTPQALAAELRDVLFVPGQPRSRKVFLRAADGRVTGFADRREGRDLVWTRTGP